MSTRHAIAVDFGRKQLRAVWAGGGRLRGAGGARGRGALKVRRTLVEDVPHHIDVQNPESLGAWAGEQLKAAGFPRSKAVVLIGREHVLMKRLSLPTVEAAELPDMVRLAMSRELPFDVAGAVIDFLPLGSTSVSTSVLAVATSDAVIQHQLALARAAGLTVGRIALRTLGAAAVTDDAANASWALSLLDQGNSEALPCTMVIDVRRENVEIAVLRKAFVEFSRAAEVPEPQDKLAIAEAIVTETRRTWMSYHNWQAGAHEAMRQAGDAPGVDGAGAASRTALLHEALLLGERRVCEYAAGPVGQLLGVPARAIDAHSCVDAAGHEIDRVWPLVGALLEESNARNVIDFANPRRAPDLGARARQRRLMVAGIAIVALIGAWTVARTQLRSLSRQANELLAAQREQSPDVARYFRDRYKLEHITKWESTNVDWLQHASYLTTIAPGPDRLVLNAWSGSLKCDGVKYARGKWSANAEVTISIDGEARDRATADGFRDTLVQSSVYEANTPGADSRAGRRMPIAFTYRLRTRQGSALPPAAAPAHDSTVVTASGGTP